MLYNNYINIITSFVAILTLIYIYVIIRTKKPSSIVLKVTSLMIVIWILSGIILYRLHTMNIDDFISNLINIAVAIGTVGAVITSLFLYNKSAKDNYDNMVKNQRAYIVLDKVEIKSIPNNNKAYSIIFIFKNSGLSLAKNIRYLSYQNYYCENTNDLPTIDCINDEDNLTRVTICASNSTFTANSHLNEKDLISNIINGKQLYFCGLIEYNDIYSNNKHITKFSKWINVMPYDGGIALSERSGKVNEIS